MYVDAWIVAAAAALGIIVTALTVGCPEGDPLAGCLLNLRRSGRLPNGVVGESYSVTLEDSSIDRGDAVPESAELAEGSGPLPPGLALDAKKIRGRPTQEGTFTFTVIQRGSCFDGRFSTQVQETYTITIGTCAPLVLRESDLDRLPDGEVGLEYSFTFTVESAEGTAAWSNSGEGDPVPPGLALSPEGVLSGTPTEEGTFELILQVTDACEFPEETLSPRAGNTEFRRRRLFLTLKIHPPGAPDLNCQSLDIGVLLPQPPDGTLDEAYPVYNFVAASADGAVTWAVVLGSLPPGLTLSPDGMLSGTPTQEGTFDFTLRATDSCPRPQIDDTFVRIRIQPRTVCIDLDMAPAPAPPAGTVGVAYLFQPSIAGGNGNLTLSVGPASPSQLPPGLTISGLSVQGTPTAEGTFEVHLLVTDECPLGAQTDLTGFTFTINPGGCPRLDVLAGTQPPQITLGESFDFVIPVSGGVAPITLQISPQGESLPPGCSFDGTRVTGTPTVTGVFQVLFEATDSCPGGVQFDAEFFDFVINP